MLETLAGAVAELDKTRIDLLFDPAFDDESGFDLVARMEFLQAMSLLEAGINGLKKAILLQSRALAAEPRSRM